MSQVSKKVQWCLNKAKRELDESGTHRGLVQGKPDQKIAVMHIAKAEHNLRAASYFREGGYSDWSMNAFFYSNYHCFLAIIRSFGYESRNQECTISLVKMLNEEGVITINESYIQALISSKGDERKSIVSLREIMQYGVTKEFSDTAEFERLVQFSKKLIDVTRQIVLATSK